MIKIFLLFTTLLFFSTTLLSRSTIEIGKASYYADKFHGRKTASGELYERKKFTAAHKTLPFNTIVKITSKKDKKSVIVRINDRGPHVKKRIIDLSRIAAEKINLINVGEAQVILTVIGMGKTSENPDQDSYLRVVK
jgi:rare lipoprotein A